MSVATAHESVRVSSARDEVRSVRIVVALEPGLVSGHVADFVEWLVARPGVECFAITSPEESSAPSERFPGEAWLGRLDRNQILNNPILARHLSRCEVPDDRLPRIASLRELAGQPPDFVVMLGGGIRQDELARECIEGAVAIDPAANDIDRVALATIDQQEASLPFRITCVDRSGSSQNLVQGALSTHRSIERTASACLRRMLQLLQTMIDARLATGGWRPDIVGVDTRHADAQSVDDPRSGGPGPVGVQDSVGPGTGAPIRHLARRAYGSLRSRMDRLAGIEEVWQVGVVHGHWRDADLREPVELQAPARSILADPFLIHRDGRSYCFAEAMDLDEQRGYIVTYELSEPGPARFLGTALEEGFHLSFPYLFEFEGELYMCPETHECGQIRVYRCTDFPLKWQPCAVLMDSVVAVDTMLFEHAGRWWMLTNLDPAGVGDLCSELHLFHAESPLSSRWKAHPANPLIIDPERARNAGLLRDGSKLFRVSQQQGFERYGVSTTIHEIVTLNRLFYEERAIRRIEPDVIAGATGTHHLHGSGSMTVFDYRVRQRVGR